MLKIEKKVLEWVEKYMFALMALLAIAIGLYLKRIAVWWGSPDVAYYFDNHENNVQSSLYYLLVQLTQYLPTLPLHSVKWLAGIADFAVAVLCVLAVGGHKEQLKLKSTFYFTVCVLSPVVFLRGICWAQVDAVAFAFLLGAYILWKKEKRILATVLAVAGVTLYPAFLLIAAGWLLYECKGTPGKNWIYLGALAAGVVLLQGVCGLLTGQSWADGVMSCVRWTTYDPYTGVAFTEPLLWVKQMVNVFGYAAAMVSGIAAYRHKTSYVTTLVIHLAVLLVYASMMFPISV